MSDHNTDISDAIKVPSSEEFNAFFIGAIATVLWPFAMTVLSMLIQSFLKCSNREQLSEWLYHSVIQIMIYTTETACITGFVFRRRYKKELKVTNSNLEQIMDQKAVRPIKMTNAFFIGMMVTLWAPLVFILSEIHECQKVGGPPSGWILEVGIQVVVYAVVIAGGTNFLFRRLFKKYQQKHAEASLSNGANETL